MFQEFPSIKPPTALLVSQLTPLQPRFYSISSSPIIFPNSIHLTVAVVTYRILGVYNIEHKATLCEKEIKNNLFKKSTKTKKLKLWHSFDDLLSIFQMEKGLYITECAQIIFKTWKKAKKYFISYEGKIHTFFFFFRSFTYSYVSLKFYFFKQF